MFVCQVCQICHGRIYCGTEIVIWLWWPGQLDFLYGSKYTYNLWLGLCPNDNNIRYLNYVNCWGGTCVYGQTVLDGKYILNYKGPKQKNPTSNDMPLCFTPFSINH